MSFIVVGDPHLGKGQNLSKALVGRALNTRHIDQINLLNWVYDKAVELNIFNIVLTGDVFDEPKPHYSVVGILIDWLKKCQNYDIKVHIVMGNHDMLRSGQHYASPLDLISNIDLEGIYVYKDLSSIEIDGVGITIVPFRDRRSFNTFSNAEAINNLKSIS